MSLAGLADKCLKFCSLNIIFPLYQTTVISREFTGLRRNTYLFWSSSFSCRSCPISDRIPRSVLVRELIWLRSSCSICLLACRSAFNFLISCSNLRKTILKDNFNFISQLPKGLSTLYKNKQCKHHTICLPPKPLILKIINFQKLYLS